MIARPARASHRARITWLLAALVAAIVATLTASPALAGSAGGTVEYITVDAPSLEGNLEGTATRREVVVYLPPGYAAHPKRRYPVVYLLHGGRGGARDWAKTLGWPETPDRTITSGTAGEMILVIPDAVTVHQGSVYSSSVTTGDWEGFVVRDLVSQIDRKYRTLATAGSRGLGGHMSGGYGTLRIGMKYPDVFQSIYSMTACCVAPRLYGGVASPKAEKLTSVEQLAQADAGMRVIMGWAAAWSPNPGKPPFYLDLPTRDGEVQQEVLARWAANAPLAMVHQYIPQLRRLRAIAFDIGLQDSLLKENMAFDETLTAYGLPHVFETYEGGHFNRIPERFETRLLPFFSRNLAFEKATSRARAGTQSPERKTER